MRRRTHRALISFMCMLLLLAQQAGLAHAVWHAKQQQLAAQQQQRYDDAPRHSQAPDATSLCTFDLAFGHVLGAGPCSKSTCSAGAAAHDMPLPEQYGFRPPEFLAPLSRGPPVLL